jgi:hypothetical protein
MNPSSENPFPEESDPLDRLLAEARWPEPREEAIERLRDNWRRLVAGENASPAVERRGVSRRTRRRAFALATALAASLVLAGGIAWSLRPRIPAAPHPTAPLASDQTPAPNVKPETPPSQPSLPEAPPSNGIVKELSRPPNAFEQLVVTAAKRANKSQTKPRVAEDPALQTTERLEQLLDDLDELSFEEWQMLKGNQQEILERLSRMTQRSSDTTTQTRALRMMERLAGQQAVAWLRPFFTESATRQEAIRLAAPHAASLDLARSLAIEGDPQVRQVLLAALLNRQDRKSLAMFLGYVERRPARGEALRAARQAAHPPIDLLCEAIQQGSYERQMAAALVLGQVSDKAVVQRLATIVSSNPQRQPALAALLSSRHPAASQALARAARCPEVAASLDSVRAQLPQMIP